MAKLTAWLVTLIGVLLVLQLLAPATFKDQLWVSWLAALAVLVTGYRQVSKKLQKKTVLKSVMR